MCTGLLIIDVQNDYFSGGKLPLEKTEATLSNIIKLKEKFEVNQLPVFLIQHIKENQTDFFEKNTTGAEIHKALCPLGTENHLVIKNYPNSFFKTDLKDKLRIEKVDRLVIVGMMTHMCVDSTTRAASEIGYQPIVISDACTTKKLTFDKKTIDYSDVHFSFLSALQNFADIMTTADFLDDF